MTSAHPPHPSRDSRRSTLSGRPGAPLARGLAVAVLAVALGGCAADRYHATGVLQEANGHPREALKYLREASLRAPRNAQYQIDYVRQRDHLVNGLIGEADRARTEGRFDAAAARLDEAAALDPDSERLRKARAALDLDRRGAAALKEAAQLEKEGQLDAADARVRRVLAENATNAEAARLARAIAARRSKLRQEKKEQNAQASIMKKPVTLQFRNANVRMVFEALARTTGLNVIFDRDVKPDLKTTIFVTNASLGDTVDMILLQSQLAKKVLNANTLFIYPATPAKAKEYQELKVRTFQLSNIEAKQVQSLLKSLLKIKDVVIDERANTVTIRDTPETIRVAEKMIAAHDLPEPEVMLEVKVLEVSHDRATNLGIQWPNSFGVATPGSVATWGDLRSLKRDQLTVTPLSASANLKLSDTDANLLASPSIRARNKEKAKILIGDRVPVISSSSTPSTSGPSYSQSIQYLDVGIKLEVEPQVYRDDDVGIKLNLEVSNITNTISSSNAQTGLSSLAYQIGTRSASTSLRLKDGETQILGGLIQDEDRDAADKVPGLGQLPIAGRLFSNHNGDNKKTEIVLMITPHIIRPAPAANADTREVWSGTDAEVRAEPLRLDPVGAVKGGMPALPGNVGGGSDGAAAPYRPAVLPAAGSFGLPPVPPRTVPPAEPFGGRFSTIRNIKTPPVTSPSEQAPAGQTPAGQTSAGQTPASAPPAPTVTPATGGAAAPAPSSNGGSQSDNPLHPIPSGN